MPPTLSEKQKRFTHMIAQLIEFAYSNGYTLIFGDAYRDPRCTYGNSNSNHKIRLAVDFNLFNKDGKYLDRTEDHTPLGEYWESIGGSWGGRFAQKDGNHYSLEHNGRR